MNTTHLLTKAVPKTKVEPVMYIFLNKGIKMSKGKIAVQAAHASCKAMVISKPEILKEWDNGPFVKIMLEALNDKHIYTIEKYLNDNNIHCITICDEGRTEIEPGSITALGVEIIDREKYKPIMSGFKLY